MPFRATAARKRHCGGRDNAWPWRSLARQMHEPGLLQHQQSRLPVYGKTYRKHKKGMAGFVVNTKLGAGEILFSFDE